jgi:replicative DNA helicase
MKDLRESGNLESDADGIILLHQPRSADSPTVYARDRAAFDVWAKQGLKYTVIAIEKQRMGNTGRISMLFDGAHMRYLEIARDK